MAYLEEKKFKRKDVAYLLEHLYYVSLGFNEDQYETYVHATHVYLHFVKGISLSLGERLAYNRLYFLASTFSYHFKDDERYCSILAKYYSVDI